MAIRLGLILLIVGNEVNEGGDENVIEGEEDQWGECVGYLGAKVTGLVEIQILYHGTHSIKDL